MPFPRQMHSLNEYLLTQFAWGQQHSPPPPPPPTPRTPLLLVIAQRLAFTAAALILLQSRLQPFDCHMLNIPVTISLLAKETVSEKDGWHPSRNTHLLGSLQQPSPAPPLSPPPPHHPLLQQFHIVPPVSGSLQNHFAYLKQCLRYGNSVLACNASKPQVKCAQPHWRRTKCHELPQSLNATDTNGTIHQHLWPGCRYFRA